MGVLEHRTSKDDFVCIVWITGVHTICSLLQSIESRGEVGGQHPGFLVMIERKLKELGCYF